MGAYKYISELYKKKQSDVLRFLLRVRFVEWTRPLIPANCSLIQVLGVPSTERYPPGLSSIPSR